MNIKEYRREKIHHRVYRHIHVLRSKPEHHKRAIALTIAIVFTLFVFMIWYFISLPKIMESYKINQNEIKRVENKTFNDIKSFFEKINFK